MLRTRSSVVVGVALVAAAFTALIGCSLGQAKREMMGGATASGERVLDTNAPPPKMIYVADFAVDEGAIKPDSGLIAEVGQAAAERPHLLGAGGILGRRLTSDQPTAEGVVDTLASSMTEALNQQNLGFPAERLAPGMQLPASGWVITGRFVS